jgi:hypothetical protein
VLAIKKAGAAYLGGRERQIGGMDWLTRDSQALSPKQESERWRQIAIINTAVSWIVFNGV